MTITSNVDLHFIKCIACRRPRQKKPYNHDDVDLCARWWANCLRVFNYARSSLAMCSFESHRLFDDRFRPQLGISAEPKPCMQTVKSTDANAHAHARPGSTSFTQYKRRRNLHFRGDTNSASVKYIFCAKNRRQRRRVHVFPAVLC